MRAKKGLQKLTGKNNMINQLLSKKKITKEDYETLLNIDEKKVFAEILTKKINETKGEEKDELLEQISEIIPTDTKNQLWESNHFLITQSISKLIELYGKMPTKNQIANDTGISRQTIHKHLNGYAEHPLYVEQMKQFKFMADRILAKVIREAGQGNIKAARLYFEIMGNFKGQPVNSTLIKNQNNYIQINGMVLSQEAIKRLTPEQLNQIEAVLKNVSNNFPETEKKVVPKSMLV